jgi:hypothetical protein
MTIDYAALDERFVHHPPSEDRATCHQSIRDAGRTAALRVMEVVPEGRERALALTKIEEFVMWANAGIALEGH